MNHSIRQTLREQRGTFLDWVLIVIGVTGLMFWATDILARFS